MHPRNDVDSKIRYLESENATHKEEKALFFNEIDRLKADKAKLKEPYNHVTCLWCATEIPADRSCDEGRIKFLADMATHLLACDKHPLARRIAEFAAENAKLKELITAAECPNCDKSGAYYDGHGEVCQCKWCYEYSLVMKE